MLNTILTQQVSPRKGNRTAASSVARSARTNIPNAETIAAIEEARAGKGLKSYASVKAMMSDILGEDD